MYKKYIYKNGKKIGPYYYESKRIGSTIKTVYLGTKPRKKVALPPPEPIINQNFFILLLISLSILGLFFLKAYTGFTIIQPYDDSLNLNINHSQSYIWEVQNPGDLNYLKVSGLILGTGNVKISIQNNNLTYVILDSSIPNLLTGSVIEPDIYNIVDTSKGKEKNISKQDNLTPENINETSLLENLSIENIILSGIYSVVDAIKKDKTINITSSNESEISQSSLNLTEDKIISRFTEVCIETCVLINFSSNSYKFLFELENATVVLENIEYSIKIPEIQQENISQIQLENLTSNIKNISIENLTLNQTLNLALENITAIPNISGLEIKDSKKQKIKYNIIKQDKDELEIEIQNKHIRKIDFKGIKNLTDIYIDDVPKEKITEKKFKKIYAIDPTLLDFDNATLTITATGNQLYKCKDWNFTEQKCYGSWVKILNLEPGKDYSFIITKEDPAFGEINITKALHLDSNYSIISDIYDQVKAKEGIWSDPIHNNEYARVTFYQNLTNENDITVYVRNIQGFNTFIEVYSEDSQSKIVEFPLIINEGYYQVLLKNMTGSYQVFDLKIKSDNTNAHLEFDHIIDPIISVTLDDPTNGNLVKWSSSWFWMNCTAAEQGQPDTEDSLWFEHNNTAAVMRKIPVNATSSTLNTTSTNPIDPFAYDTQYKVNVSTPNANNYQIQCIANNTAGVTKTSVVRKITVLQTNVTLNQSTLNLGSTDQDAMPLMKSAIVFSNGTNNDINISCLTGSCSTITTNFTSVDLTDNQTKTAFFNCSTSTAGFFSANFTVNSTEYQNSTLTDTKQMNVSCTIIADIIPPNILIVNPSNNSVLTSNKTYVNYTYGIDTNAIWYELDSNNTNITITTGNNITFIDLPLTIHNISVYANDSINNINSSFINFSIIDATPPDIKIVNPSNNSVLTTNYTYVNYTYGADSNAIWYEFDSNNTNISITIGQNITFNSLADGFYNISLFANDSSNNINSSFINFSVKYVPFVSYCSGNFNNSKTAFKISSNVECSNETMDINGNITISSGGNLTFKNITLRFTGAGANGYNYINKSKDGGLWILDNDNNASTSNDASNISSSTAYKYDFWAHGVGANDNFTLQNSIVRDAGYSTAGTSQGLQLYNVSNVVVSGNNVSGGALYGLYLINSTNNNLSNNQMNTDYGIYLFSSSNSTIQSNTITTSDTNANGIYLDTSSNNTLSSNTITTNGSSGYGIYLFSSSNSNTLQSNTITTNDTLSYGAYILTSDLNNLSLNTINSSNSDSIFIDTGSDNNTISSNTLKFSKYSGIRIQNSTSGIMPQNNTITNNNITNATNGISIFMNSTRPFAVNNTIENNNITFTTNAIYISNSSNINVSLGIIRNSTNGIVLFNSKQVNATNITFTSNTYDFNITNGSALSSINNSFNKTVKVLDNSNFTIIWFAEVYVNDNQSNTNVSVWNSTGVKHANFTTNSAGLTSLFLLTEYIRNNTNNLTDNNPFNFTADNTTLFNSTSVNVDRSMRIKIGFEAGANTAPTVNNLTLTPSFPNTTINLNCSFVVTDSNAGDTLTVNLTWYKNNTINLTYTGISVTNGTLNLHYLNNANTTKNDNWTCGVRPYDATVWGNEVNSSTVTIQNSQPTAPTLSSPADGNKTTNKTETFYWNPSTDPDNDAITYTINISCWGGCSADNRLVNTTSINYTPAELRYFIDDNYYYNWTVKAIDSDANSSSYAAERNLSLQVLVSLTLPNSTVLFGTKNIGDSINTSNNTPSPIVMQNDGNSYINVNLSAQSMLFTTEPNPSTNFRYKIDNTSIEAGSFNWSGSVTTWANIPLQNNTAVNLLNYSNLNDTAEMDILITVPSNEPPGNLTSNLILTGYYTAYYP